MENLEYFYLILFPQDVLILNHHHILLELILDLYSKERDTYQRLMAEPDVLEEALHGGEQKAAAMANKKLAEVRALLGYS